MASIAAAWALGIDWQTIATGLSTFVNDAQTAPGRFNVFDYRGATVIADYGHNPDAIQALIQAIETMPAKRRMVVISGAGDRRDEDIVRILSAALALILGEFLAIDTALAKLEPGDLCLILIDQVQEALDHIALRVKQG